MQGGEEYCQARKLTSTFDSILGGTITAAEPSCQDKTSDNNNIPNYSRSFDMHDISKKPREEDAGIMVANETDYGLRRASFGGSFRLRPQGEGTIMLRFKA